MMRMFATQRIGENAQTVSDEYKNWSEDYLLLPNWSEVRPNELPENEVELIKGDGKLEVQKLSDVAFSVNATLNSQSDINFNKLFFPGWFVYVDGERYQTEPSRPVGSIKIVDVPRGEHAIKLAWREPGLRLIFDIVSLVSLLIIIVIYFKGDEIKRLKKFLAG
jgi:uncharacterized membrane protein YfhO